MIEQISNKDTILAASGTIPPFEATTSNGSPFSNGAVEELEVLFLSQFLYFKLVS